MLLAIGDGALDALLAQDAPTGDLTTHALGIGRVAGRITFAARADMVLCCAEEAARMLERVGVTATLHYGSGDRIAAGTVFLEGALDFHGLKRRHPEKKLVVEVSSVEAALAAAEAGADVLQLEKLPPDAVGVVVRRVSVLPQHPLVAAAGGLNEANAAAYAATGCAVLVTSAPYFSGPADVKVVISAIEDFAGERS